MLGGIVMKVTIKVTELNHANLVDILSTALYGCDWLAVDYDLEFFKNIPNDKKSGHCFEDHLADVLLNGGIIKLTDLESDGELYKTRGVPCKVKKEFSPYNPNEFFEVGVYSLALKAILKACSTERGYKLLTETISGEGDYFTANNLLQIAMFGKEIYG